jgi:hypothetical protein
MIRNRTLFTIMVAATLFATSAFSGPWLSSLSTVYAQASNNSSQAMAVDQLASNLTQAREAIASGNTTSSTAQLTAIIGQLSDILGTVTSDPNGEATDEHTHFFVHKGHTHTVTASSKPSSRLV